MRKPVIHLLALLLLLTGCATLFPPKPSPVPDPAHSSQNSLDWHGVYTGILPGTDAPDVMLLLHPNETFRMEFTGSSEIKGTFRWLDGGNAIELALPRDSDWPSLYRVGENRLTPVSPVSGPLAAGFLLRETNRLKETTWQLVANQSEREGAPAPFLIVKALGNQITGFAGCNHFFGNYTLSGENGISFFNIASTKMACPALVAEEGFIHNLGLVSQYRITATSLLLLNSDEDLLIALEGAGF